MAGEKEREATDRAYDEYLNTIARLEPDLHMIDAGAGWASIAISLKRIADVLEAQAQQEASVKKPGEVGWTRKYSAPAGTSLVEYVQQIMQALRENDYHVSTVSDKTGYLLFSFRTVSTMQWTQAYRREGNDRMLRVTGPEASVIAELVMRE